MTERKNYYTIIFIEDGQIKLDETGNFNNTWAEMEKVLTSGKVKTIGLSNFSIKMYTSTCSMMATFV